MSRLARYTQKLFGSTANIGRISEFGSLQAGTPTTYSGATVTPADIQALGNFLQGWDGAVIGNNSPAIQDLTALDYLWGYQISYILQAGIPEYDPGTTYYIFNFCQYNGAIYQSEIDNNIGNTPSSSLGSWVPVGVSAISPHNYLINGNFDFFQRGVNRAALGTPEYVADRWYIYQNGYTSGGGADSNQTSAPVPGSVYGLQFYNVSGGAANGIPELYQVLENLDSVVLYNQIPTVSFSIYVKGLTNVTQVGISFVYTTTQAKSTGTNLIGSEQFFTINSSSYTLCQIFNQLNGGSYLPNGCIGIRIRPTAVSSGNLYDVDNGLAVAQAQLNNGLAPALFRRCGESIEGELTLCQRYFEMSYNQAATPGSATQLSGSFAYFNGAAVTETKIFTQVKYATTKIPNSSPTITLYSPESGASGMVFDETAVGDLSATASQPGESGFNVTVTSLPSVHTILGHFTADYDF